MSLHTLSATHPSAPHHVVDGDLVRFHDGELLSEARVRVAAHLGACATCAERLSALLAIAERLHGAYGEPTLPAALTAPPWRAPRAVPRLRVPRLRVPRFRPPARVVWRATAAVALFAAGVAAAAPVRGWLRAWSGTHRVASGARVGASSPQPSARPVVWHVAELAFRPDAERLTVELEGRSGDTVSLRADSGDVVRVRARSRNADPVLLALPSGVRLSARGSGGSALDVAVPHTVEIVEVRSGDLMLARVPRGALDAGRAWRVRVP